MASTCSKSEDANDELAGTLNNFVSLNVRGLLLKSNRTKPQQLGSMLCLRKSFGCVISESWLTSDVLNPEICVEGYNVFRSDRVSRIGGGVCVYMRNDLTVT